MKQIISNHTLPTLIELRNIQEPEEDVIGTIYARIIEDNIVQVANYVEGGNERHWGWSAHNGKGEGYMGTGFKALIGQSIHDSIPVYSFDFQIEYLEWAVKVLKEEA